jgi:hypothetical protein
MVIFLSFYLTMFLYQDLTSIGRSTCAFFTHQYTLNHSCLVRKPRVHDRHQRKYNIQIDIFPWSFLVHSHFLTFLFVYARDSSRWWSVTSIVQYWWCSICTKLAFILTMRTLIRFYQAEERCEKYDARWIICMTMKITKKPNGWRKRRGYHSFFFLRFFCKHPFNVYAVLMANVEWK